MKRSELMRIALVCLLVLLIIACAGSAGTATPQAPAPASQIQFSAEKVAMQGAMRLFVITINGEKIPCLVFSSSIGYGGGVGESCDWAKQSDFAQGLNQ